MNRNEDAGSEMQQLHQPQPIPTDQNKIESPSPDDLSIRFDEESPHNKFKVFRGRHIQMMALGKFLDLYAVLIGQGCLSEQEFYMSPVTTFLLEVPCVPSWRICGPGVCFIQSWKVSGSKPALTLLDDIG